jgi:hypothetical protein
VPRRVKTEVFAELSDPVLFPRLSEAKMERATKRVAGAVGDGALAVRFAYQVLHG